MNTHETFADTIVCPPKYRLMQLVEEGPHPENTTEVLEHLKVCETCQETLVEISTLGISNEDAPAVDRSLRTTNLLRGGSHTAEWQQHLTPQSPPEQFGAYRIVEKVAEGGCGILYRAYDDRLHREVALKVLHGDYASSKTARRRIAEEARAAAAIKHEGIVTIFDIDTESETPPYIVMEFVDGPTLRDYLAETGPLDCRHAASLIRQVAMALSMAHEADLIHRDIKPSNIMLETDGTRAKLADFGLALKTTDDAPITSDNVVTGTPAYMSPEQIATPSKVHASTDIYSLGVTLYEAVTSTKPYSGELRTILTRILHETPTLPSELNESLDPNLEAICLKAMQKEEHLRYLTASDFADDLGRFLNDEPVVAARRQKNDGGSRTSSTLRSIALIAGAFTVVASIGFAVMFGQRLLRSKLSDGLRLPFATVSTEKQLDGVTDVPDKEHGDAALAASNSTHHDSAASFIRVAQAELDRANEAMDDGNVREAETRTMKAIQFVSAAIKHHEHPEIYSLGCEALSLLLDVSVERGDETQAQQSAQQHLRFATAYHRLFPNESDGHAVLAAAYLDMGDLMMWSEKCSTARSFYSRVTSTLSGANDLLSRQIYVEACLGIAESYELDGSERALSTWLQKVETAIASLEPRGHRSEPEFTDWLEDQKDLIDALRPASMPRSLNPTTANSKRPPLPPPPSFGPPPHPPRGHPPRR